MTNAHPGILPDIGLLERECLPAYCDPITDRGALHAMAANPEPKRIDLELLPEEWSGDVRSSRNLPRLVALLMDDLLRVPGTKMRFGLNPIMDLIPVVGDGAAAVISTLTLFAAARNRVPKVVIARMGLNIILNALIGIIPGIGEAFALWFRPSHRNYNLLKLHMNAAAAGASRSTKGDTLFVFAIVAVVLALFAVCIAIGFSVSLFIWRAFQGHG